MHEAYGGVVPELASRDHLRRLVPLAREVFARAGRRIEELGAVAYTEGPGLAGALLAGAAFARSLAHTLGVPAVGIHHLEGHLLSPLLSAKAIPFVALLVGRPHATHAECRAWADTSCSAKRRTMPRGRGLRQDRKLLGLGYPGGPALSDSGDRQARRQAAAADDASGDLDQLPGRRPPCIPC
jgi:N6-L-threonylcarbamoyladenine synthase